MTPTNNLFLRRRKTKNMMITYNDIAKRNSLTNKKKRILKRHWPRLVARGLM